jgi:hypothetical protein
MRALIALALLSTNALADEQMLVELVAKSDTVKLAVPMLKRCASAAIENSEGRDELKVCPDGDRDVWMFDVNRERHSRENNQHQRFKVAVRLESGKRVLVSTVDNGTSGELEVFATAR